MSDETSATTTQAITATTAALPEASVAVALGEDTNAVTTTTTAITPTAAAEVDPVDAPYDPNNAAAAPTTTAIAITPAPSAISTVVTTTAAAATSSSSSKKRLCRYPGCTRVIKSQGHCQRHGARAKRCKVEGCDKQAQGTHEGMCKRHWKAIHYPESIGGNSNQAQAPPPPPEGNSVYDTILPQSISYRPTSVTTTNTDLATNTTTNTQNVSVMPLVAYLKEGTQREAGWHRNGERRARGMYPVQNLSTQLEPWERQLALVEILLLSGGTPLANFKDLAHGWGREKGFHQVLSSSVCERRGEVERKRRSDAGKSLTAEEKTAFKQKIQKTRAASAASLKGPQAESAAMICQEIPATTTPAAVAEEVAATEAAAEETQGPAPDTTTTTMEEAVVTTTTDTTTVMEEAVTEDAVKPDAATTTNEEATPMQVEEEEAVPADSQANDNVAAAVAAVEEALEEDGNDEGHSIEI